MSRKSKLGANEKLRKSRKSRKSAGKTASKPSAKQVSRKLPITKYKKTPSQPGEQQPMSHASQSMNLTDLQFMARSLGIPFGGLTKTALIHKINLYK